MVVATLLFSPILHASQVKTVSIETAVQAGRGVEAQLEVTLTARHESMSHGRLEIFSDGGAIEPLSDITAVTLPVDVPVRVYFSLQPSRASSVSAIMVSFVPMATDAAAATSLTYVAGRGRGVRAIDAALYEKLLREEQAADAKARAESEANERVQALLSRGDRPGLIYTTQAEETAWTSAWNRAAAPHSASVRAATCGIYTLSPNNYTFAVSGELFYQQANGSYQRFRASGHPVTLTTTVEETDGCGSYRYVSQSVSITSGSVGYVSFPTVRSWRNPAANNPIDTLTVTPQSAGEVADNLTMTIVPQQMAGTNTGWYWNGYEGKIAAQYGMGKSVSPYFLRWEDQIRRLRLTWNAWGLSAYANFRAGRNNTLWPTLTAYFQEYNSSQNGIVLFTDAGAFIPEWFMAHEFGHQLQFNLQGTLGSGDEHTYCSLEDPRVAFVEGFADWHGNRMETIGRPAEYTCTAAECQSACPIGQGYQGNVADYFWDVFDDYNHPTDDGGVDPPMFPYSIMPNYWRSNCGSSCYTSFNDWFIDYANKGVWGGNLTNMTTLRAYNGVQ